MFSDFISHPYNLSSMYPFALISTVDHCTEIKYSSENKYVPTW